jgi:hypothetical protein
MRLGSRLALAAALVWAWTGCATVPPVADGVPQVAPLEAWVQRVEAEQGTAAVLDPGRARALQGELPQVRSELDDALTWQEIACYRRFWTYRCVGQVKERRRRLEDRVARVDGAVAQALRHEAAVLRAQAEAQRLAVQAEQSEAEQAMRAQQRLAYERKQAAAAARAAQPPAPAPRRRPSR